MKRISLVVSRQKFINGASDAAMAYSNERGRLQKAAAWQWFMHGAGAEAQVHAAVSAKMPVHNIITGSGTHLPKQASRFATEPANAVADASASLADDPTESYEHPHGHLHKGEEVSDPFRTGRPHVEKMMPSITNDSRQKRHLHLRGFPKLLHKLVMSTSFKRSFSSTWTITPDEEEVQHHYHHYIHHHHHHYYHGGAGSDEEVEVIEQPHLGYTEHTRRRRHSESGFNQQPYLQKFYHEYEKGEEDDNCKVKVGGCRAFSRHSEDSSSKQDLQRPIKDFTSGEEIVVEQELNKCPSLAFARRHNSERFTTTPKTIMLTNGNQDIHRFFIRGGSERRTCAEGTYTIKESRDHCMKSGPGQLFTPERHDSPNVALGPVTPMDVQRPRRHSTSCFTASKPL